MRAMAPMNLFYAVWRKARLVPTIIDAALLTVVIGLSHLVRSYQPVSFDSLRPPAHRLLASLANNYGTF
jgi:hypothetical protein